MSSDEVQALSQKVCTQLIQSKHQWDHNEFSIVGLYSPIRGEVNALSLFGFFKNLGKTCSFPRVVSTQEKKMDFVSISDLSELKPGKFDIAEPNANSSRTVLPEILLVPGAAFSKDGHRLGYGAGFYDVFLARLRKQNAKVLAIGLAYDFQVQESLLAQQNDEPLDFLATETCFYSFRK